LGAGLMTMNADGSCRVVVNGDGARDMS
jgi:hypothetical protein